MLSKTCYAFAFSLAASLLLPDVADAQQRSRNVANTPALSAMEELAAPLPIIQARFGNQSFNIQGAPYIICRMAVDLPSGAVTWNARQSDYGFTSRNGDNLALLIQEIRGLRQDLRQRGNSGLAQQPTDQE